MIKKNTLLKKLRKKKRSFFTLRIDPPKVLAMGVDDGGQKGSKEGLIFKIPFAKLKNKSKSIKNMKMSKNDKIRKSVKIEKIRKTQKVIKS